MLGSKIRKVIDHRIINERLDGLTFQGVGKKALEELDQLIEKANRVDELEKNLLNKKAMHAYICDKYGVTWIDEDYALEWYQQQLEKEKANEI